MKKPAYLAGLSFFDVSSRSCGGLSATRFSALSKRSSLSSHSSSRARRLNFSLWDSSLELAGMTHSFVAFVDESGSEGDPDKIGGFEFITLSAAVFRVSNLQFTTELWAKACSILKKKPTFRIGDFKNTNSDTTKYLIASLIAESPMQFASVMMHKPSHEKLGTSHGDLYLFASQLLLERISWICRDGMAKTPLGDGTVKIIFSERKSLRADRFRTYAERIRVKDCPYPSHTEWSHIRIPQIVDRPHHLCDGLRVADFIAASFGAAIEPNKKFGLTDDRFLVRMMSRAYRPAEKHKKIWRNGIKLHPIEAETPLLKEDRFRWVRTHCK